jgi:hypothetical protein
MRRDANKRSDIVLGRWRRAEDVNYLRDGLKSGRWRDYAPEVSHKLTCKCPICEIKKRNEGY